MKLNKFFLSLITIISSCFNQTDNTYTLKDAKDIEEISYKEYSDPLYKAFSSKLLSFSNNFSDNYITENKNENYVVSPLSLYMAMSLVVESTSNNTRQELLDSLNMSYDEVLNYTKILFALSNREIKNQGRTISKELLDNSMWFAPQLSLKQECIDSLANNYYCSSYETDFSNNNKQANQDIRKYIKEKTNDLIDRDFGFDERVVLLLMNTLYVKDSWNEFGEISTTSNKYNFKNYDGKVNNTYLLQGHYCEGKAYSNSDISSMYIESNNGYRLFFLKPNDNKDINDVFTKDNLDRIVDDDNYICSDNNYEYYTRIMFPEFEVETTSSLVPTLQNMGINDLFNSCVSDFSNLSNDDLVCSDVIQSAKLIVNKKGFEGAAVTIFQNECTSIMPVKEKVYYDFVVDKSFGYVLLDCYDNALFSGIIYNI